MMEALWPHASSENDDSDFENPDDDFISKDCLNDVSDGGIRMESEEPVSSSDRVTDLPNCTPTTRW